MVEHLNWEGDASRSLGPFAVYFTSFEAEKIAYTSK
jgi:hypothetical protein